MEQEHRIAYKAGITRTPSDFLCSDGELAECINLATDNEELKPMVQPASFITSCVWRNTDPEISGYKVLYIHKFNNEERYICTMPVNIGGSVVDEIAWAVKDGTKLRIQNVLAEGKEQNSQVLIYDSDSKITSIGKTLVVNSNKGLFYFLWTYDNDNNSIYSALGSNFERPIVQFKLTGRNSNKVQVEISSAGAIYYDDNKCKIGLNKQDEWNDTIIGLYNEVRKKVWQKKMFDSSFCVRVALELYDGTYYHISNPIFMLNHFSAYCTARILGSGGISDPKTVKMWLYGQNLEYKFSQDYSQWSDIVKNVVLFVTKEENIFDTGSDATLLLGNSKKNQSDPDIPSNTPIAYFMSGNTVYADSETLGNITTSEGDLYRVLDSNPDSDLENSIKSGIYYKLCEIGLTGDNTYHSVGDLIDTHYLENLTTQERLGDDDYYSHCPLMSGMLYSYNSRLNLANISRGFFKGFDNFMPFDNSGESTYTYLVTIQTDGGQKVIRNVSDTVQKQGIYFFYPDPRAKHVDILKNGTQILHQDLKEHPRLNGAYYFAGVSPSMGGEAPSVTSHTPAASPPDTYESLANYIITSEANNPFVFKAEGYFKVGTGKIIGMSTITQALSQGQFGDFPLLVFSQSGIWGLSVGNDGYYSAIYPMSRDVCINSSNIIQTDGAVFFVSKKGLMLIVGNDVRCVSEQMNGQTFNTSSLSPLATGTEWAGLVTACQTGRSFLDYIRDEACFMAYDYIDSRILIINPNFSFAFAYNIADGTIAKTVLPAAMTRAVNNYPDYLLQGTWTEQVEGQTVTHNYVYSFYEKLREEQVADRTLGFILTRPMKLAGPVSQASLRQLMNVGAWNPGTTQNPLSCVKTDIYLSSDMQTWYNDISRFGAAARYYRLALFIKMLPTERLSGTILTSQERRGHNMR